MEREREREREKDGRERTDRHTQIWKNEIYWSTL